MDQHQLEEQQEEEDQKRLLLKPKEQEREQQQLGDVHTADLGQNSVQASSLDSKENAGCCVLLDTSPVTDRGQAWTFQNESGGGDSSGIKRGRVRPFKCKRLPRNPLGRPRKDKQPDSQATPTAVIKRPPGRPKKDQQSSQAPSSPPTPTVFVDAASTETRRLRVRPTKETPPAARSTPKAGIKRGRESLRKDQQSSHSPPTPTRGTKRMLEENENAGCSVLLDASTPSTKRGRGRPRKKPKLQEPGPSQAAAGQNGVQASSLDSEENVGCSVLLDASSPSIKRGRGRPRKKPKLQEPGLSQSAAPTQACTFQNGGAMPMRSGGGKCNSSGTKRGPGRPWKKPPRPGRGRKRKEKQPDSEAAPTSSIKRPRGRPRKDQQPSQAAKSPLAPAPRSAGGGMSGDMAEAGDAALKQLEIGGVQLQPEMETMSAETEDVAGGMFGDMAEASRRRRRKQEEEDLASAWKKAQTEEGVPAESVAVESGGVTAASDL